MKFRPGSAVGSLHETADAEHSEAVGRGDDLRLIRSRSKDIATLVKELSQRPDVEFAEPNYILRHQAVPNDTYYGNMWALRNTGTQYGGVAGADTDAQSAWDITTGSSNVAVGIIDTGADLNHPDLRANLWSAPSQFTVTVGGRTVTCPAGSRGFDAFTFTCYPMDDQGHGTHVAGTIGATANNGAGVTGINWRTKMVVVRTMNAANTGTAVEAINAIDFLIQANAHFAKTSTPLNVRVMSASWFIGGPSYTLYEAIQRANAANILFVAAAGNSGINTDAYRIYPAGYDLPNIISVAATDPSDNKAYFSNYGASTVDLGAPGMYILSTTLGGGYGLKHGTSMATPHVSGVAALTLSKCSLNTAQLKDAILRNVDYVPGLAGITVTGGRLNAYKTVRSCAGSAASFSVSPSPAARSITPGQSTTYSLALTPQSGFAGSVTLSVSGAPAGVSTRFSANPVYVSGGTAYPSLIVTASASTAPGTYTLAVAASGNGISRTATLTLTVTAPPSFTLAAPVTAQSVNKGGSISYSLAITPQNGFSGPVALSVTGVPSGVSASLNPGSVSLGSATVTAVLNVAASASATPGTYPLVVKASGGGIVRTAYLSLTVREPATFWMTATSAASVVAGQIASYTLNLSAYSGFSAAVGFSVGGLPPGASARFSANPIALSSTAATTLTVATSSSTPAGTYHLTITASGGGVTRISSVALTVSAPPPPPAPAPSSNLPAAPVNAGVVQMFAMQTQFKWTPGSTNHTAFQVEVCQGAGCNFSTKLSGTLPASMTSITHNPVYAGQVWSYRVRALNSYGASPWSPVATITIH